MLVSSGATLEFLKELVATSIESDDVAPLVKAVFDVPPAGEQPAATGQGDAEAGQASVAEAVLGLLQEVAEEKEAEIQQICRWSLASAAAKQHRCRQLECLLRAWSCTTAGPARLRPAAVDHAGALLGQPSLPTCAAHLSTPPASSAVAGPMLRR